MVPDARRQPHYRKGDWLVQCDECGAEIYASESARQWDGLIVCARHKDQRNPQDYKRGKPDRQAPPLSYISPEPTDLGVAPYLTTLTADAATGATALTVDDTSDFTASNLADVALDNGARHRTSIASIGGATALTIADALPSPASSGNNVIDIGVAA